VGVLIGRILATESDSSEREYAAAAIARVCAEAPEQVELIARALASGVKGEPLAALLRAVGTIAICTRDPQRFQPIAERILSVLIQRLEDGDRTLQSAIKGFVWDLGEHRPEAWELLVRLLDTGDLELRVSAALRLSHSRSPIHHEAALEALANIIIDDRMDLELRVAAANSLNSFPLLSVLARTALWHAASSKEPLLSWFARDLLRHHA
jgi:HEAT repeat protein